MEKDFEKEFRNEFQKITYRNSPSKVWSDFVEMAACSISNILDKTHFDERDQRYLEVVKSYTPEETEAICNLLAVVTLALKSNPDQDFLGKMFMDLEISNDKLDQYFTPYHVSKLTAEHNLIGLNEIINPIRINELACGSGGMIIAFMNAAKKKGINYQSDVIFAATDLNKTAALMCYIQTSFLCCAGVVTIGSSLTGECFSQWYTPMFFSDIWTVRRKIEAVKNTLKKAPAINQSLKEQKVKTLFDFEVKDGSA